MSNVPFTNLKLKNKIDIKTIEISGLSVGVLQYLPSQDKFDLISTAIEKSFIEGYCNDFLCDVYFHLNLVYLYTNISFTPKQREDELKLYDILVTNGVIDAVVSAIPQFEYENLLEAVQTVSAAKEEYSVSMAAIVSKLIDDMPKNAEEAAKIVEGFNPEKYSNVLSYAQKAGYQPELKD